MAKIIGVVALKGGVGKTSCTANIASALARLGKQVLAVDANFSTPNLSYHFGLLQPEGDLRKVLSNKVKPQSAIYEYAKQLHVLPMASSRAPPSDVFALKKKLADVSQWYDYIMIDASPNVHSEVIHAIAASDELFIVTSPDVPTLSATVHAVRVAKRKGTPIRGLIVNRVRGKTFELSIDEIEEATGVPVLGLVPDDDRMLEAVSKGVVVHDVRSGDAKFEFEKIAAFIAGIDYKDPRLWQRVKSLFGQNRIDENRQEHKDNAW